MMNFSSALRKCQPIWPKRLKGKSKSIANNNSNEKGEKVITQKVNTNLILAMTYLLQNLQELFCEDDVKRKQAIEEYKNNKQKLVEGLDYILNQAENYHK